MATSTDPQDATSAAGAEKLGFDREMVVQEFGYDDDVDHDLRNRFRNITAHTERVIDGCDPTQHWAEIGAELDFQHALTSEAQLEAIDARLDDGYLDCLDTVSGYCVTPVVARLEADARIAPQSGEVDRVFEVPLAFLMNPAHHRRHRYEWDGHVREWFSMPYVERVRVEPGAGESPPRPENEVEHFIWGATAGMLRNFYRFLSA